MEDATTKIVVVRNFDWHWGRCKLQKNIFLDISAVLVNNYFIFLKITFFTGCSKVMKIPPKHTLSMSPQKVVHIWYSNKSQTQSFLRYLTIFRICNSMISYLHFAFYCIFLVIILPKILERIEALTLFRCRKHLLHLRLIRCC
jgi:hypothetical protein